MGAFAAEFFHSARLDNQASCHAGLQALITALDSEVPGPTSVIALFDHEEIGSTTACGADSSTLDTVLRRVLRDAESQGAGDYGRAMAHSMLVSADMAHAVHPAFSDKHDAEHMPKLNAGPVIKQNVNQRYTTEADTAAMFMLLAEKADVKCQWFVNRSDLRCGSTVGPMLASHLGIRAIDVGNPMLSMHSAREMTCTTFPTNFILRNWNN